jgi:hypothetical protein
MARVLLACVLFLVASPAISAPEATPGVLVVEKVEGAIVYSMGGMRLNPDRLYRSVIDRLGPQPADHPLFILFGGGATLDQAFELGSLFKNKAGLRKLRYFAFSRHTGVMQEFLLDWQRWRFSEDGALQPKPW